MRRILLYFVLCSMAMAEVNSEVIYSKDCIVVVANKRNFEEVGGKTYYDADIFHVYQQNFFRGLLIPGWCVEFRLQDFNLFSRVYVPPAQPWELLDISKERWDDWQATGTLHTQEYIEAKKQAAEIKAAVAADRQMATAMMELTNMEYYINIKTGVWHIDPNCIDNIGTVKISPLDVLKYENRKACTKCVK